MDEEVAKSSRKDEEAADVDLQEFRRRVDAFFDRLRDTTLPPINPIQELCTLLGLSRTIAAGAFHYSYGRWSGILAGGISSVPTPVLKVVGDLSGPEGRMEFEAAWARFRESLGLQARRALEERVLSGGPGYMSP